MRLMTGDFMPGGTIDGFRLTPMMWLGINIVLAIPIVMVYLSMTLKYKTNRWSNIVLAIFFFVFNAVGLPTYPSAYDRFLIGVSLVFNVLTVWHAWKWSEQDGLTK